MMLLRLCRLCFKAVDNNYTHISIRRGLSITVETDFEVWSFLFFAMLRQAEATDEKIKMRHSEKGGRVNWIIGEGDGRRFFFSVA